MDITVPSDDRQCTVVDGFIFHLPRSGSTLVARMLAESGPHRVFIEPEAINALLTHSDSAGPPQAAWVKRLLALYRLACREECSKVIVKLPSWSILWSHLFAKASPDTPSVFVYRDPVEVMTQLLERPTGWMSRHAWPMILRVTSEEDSLLSIETYTAKVLGHIINAAHTSELPVMPVPYRLLPHIVPDRMLAHFGIKPGPETRTLLLEQARYNSEDWSLSTQFVPDADRLQERATSEVRSLVQTFVLPHLELLE